MPATDSVVMEKLDAHFDLCDKCAKQVIDFLSKPKQETVEKRGILGFGKKRVASQGV